MKTYNYLVVKPTFQILFLMKYLCTREVKKTQREWSTVWLYHHCSSLSWTGLVRPTTGPPWCVWLTWLSSCRALSLTSRSSAWPWASLSRTVISLSCSSFMAFFFGDSFQWPPPPPVLLPRDMWCCGNQREYHRCGALLPLHTHT